jgi:hypothetical protein
MSRAEQIGAKVLATLAAQAARRRQAGIALRGAIQAVMATHSGPERLTAKRIRNLLDREPLPSIRTIQDHMREINAASSVPRF